MKSIDRGDLEYQAFYCEENVWKLLGRPELREAAAWAVIVSNGRRDVVLMRQSAGRPVDGLLHWDYHVFAVAADPFGPKMAFDPDSQLPFPCPLRRYLADSFPSGVQRAFEPHFRVMKGGQYLAEFVTDRSHMRKPDGSWLAPPPPWPAPGYDKGRPSLLMRWVDMTERSPGAVYDAARMAAFAATPGA